MLIEIIEKLSEYADYINELCSDDWTEVHFRGNSASLFLAALLRDEYINLKIKIKT